MTQSSPAWPKRALITAGMPYGNKSLHFGHIAGVFVPADYLARFLRDRIGAENTLFISGTDCYGSPIMEGARKCGEDSPEQIRAFVKRNHENQREALKAFDISLNFFGASALSPAAHTHQELTSNILRRLYELDWLEMRETYQFFDAEANTFLNGRQVVGRCPIPGCKSEHAYADECDLGHQFDPKDLIAPKSQLTGATPILKKVKNWYFALDRAQSYLQTIAHAWEDCPQVRDVVTKTMLESLVPPRLYIKVDAQEAFEDVAPSLPPHTVIPPQNNQQSFAVEFENWEERDKAEEALDAAHIRFRAGKCLLPLRLTGNISWGVSADALPDAHNLTVWVWPESLWAPISFTKTLLEDPQACEAANDALFPTHVQSAQANAFWASEDAQVYQLIGQDNIYFYCLAQPALWKALNKNLTLDIPVANYHVLFMNKKASSSSTLKPPLALELTEAYTKEQLRCHWLSLGLDAKSVSFAPKAFNTQVSYKNKETGEDVLVKDDSRVMDPVLKESAFLTNIFNRLARSFFYGAQKHLDGHIPACEPSQQVRDAARKATHAFDSAMYAMNFHEAMNIAETYGREAHKLWDTESKAAQTAEQEASDNADALREQALANALHGLKTLTLLMHPATPAGTEAIARQLQIDASAFFSWENAELTTRELLAKLHIDPSSHTTKELPPKTDFFKKHPSQY